MLILFYMVFFKCIDVVHHSSTSLVHTGKKEVSISSFIEMHAFVERLLNIVKSILILLYVF